MSQQTTLILFPQTAYNGGGTAQVYSLTGNAQPAAAYYLGNKDLQTINLMTSSFTGNIVIEATLSANKDTDEYFEVYRLADCANSNISMYTNVDGNFVYMRAKIEDFQWGVVNFIKMSY